MMLLKFSKQILLEQCLEIPLYWGGLPCKYIVSWNFRNTLSLKKTEEIRVTECVSETFKTLFILCFHAELIYRGWQNVASEISETASVLSQISSKDGRKM